MILKRLNPNSSDDNAFGVSSALAHNSVDKWKCTKTITTLTNMTYLDSEGVSVTKTWSPSKTTWATIKAAIETELGVGGYYLANGEDYGLKVVPNGSDFDITFKGDVKVTTLTSGATTVAALANENYAAAGF
jgi:hypothetical protein